MESYVCPRTPHPILIDGDLSKPAWASVPWTKDFVDIEGDLKPKPRFRTRAKMCWDDHYLYIAAELEEPHVWATLTEHDSVIFHDNDFEVFIDPDGDNHLYGELELNALNTTWDLLLPKPYRDGGPAINGWEIAGLKTAVRVQGTLNDPGDTDRGWTVEIAIPFKSMGELGAMRCPPKAGDQWRINFSRVEWHVTIEGGKYVKVPNTAEDNWVWSPQGVIDMHRPEEWGVLQFSEAAAGEPLPYPGLGERRLLMKVYYSQRAFRDAHSRWAQSVHELDGVALEIGDVGAGVVVEGADLPGTADGPGAADGFGSAGSFASQGVTVIGTPTLFEAIVGEWHVDSSSRLWKGGYAPASRPTWD